MDGMQVKDLIKKLQEFDPGIEVYVLVRDPKGDVHGARIDIVEEFPGMIEIQGSE